MLPPHRRLRIGRLLRFESIEPRLMLSANPAGDIAIDDYAELFSAYAETSSLSWQSIGLDQVAAKYGFAGAGQTIAVIDSGIAYDHAALGGGYGSDYRIVGGYDFAERDNNPYDDGPRGGHGTHVAGILGGESAQATGIVAGADIVALRVFDDQGRGQFAWIEEALRWVHEHRNDFENPITTVNLSVGMTINAATVPDWAMLEDELAQLEADGIFIAVAAGNSFSMYQTAGLCYPAVSSHVVPVASVDPNGSLSYFTQRDARVIAAPGRSILSSVPDYLGNRNGVGDDFAAYSGTSMASPIVAGASMLLREAYEFVGLANVTQQTLYQTLIATADAVYDAVTGATYHRLNLDRALDSIMPADDFGSTADAAHRLGSVVDTLSLDGCIGQLQDCDWFSFTAGASGKITLTIDAQGDLSPVWSFDASVTGVAQSGQSIVFDVAAGQTYRIGISTSQGLGRYSLDLRLAPAAATSLVVQVGREVRVSGASGNDAYTLAIGDVWHLTVNGKSYDFSRQAVQSFVIDGGAGSDSIRIEIAQGNAVATLKPGATDLSGTGYRVQASNVEYVAIRAALGSNRATLYDSTGDDVFEAGPSYAELRGRGFASRVEGFSSVCAFASAGFDAARLHDSAGNDALVVNAADTTLSGSGFSNRVRGFDEVHADGTGGGCDTAILYGLTENTPLRAERKKLELSYGAVNAAMEDFEYIQAISFGAKINPPKSSAVDFVFRVVNLRI